MNAPIRIESRYQGPTGSGQGGWTANRFAERIGVPVAVSILAPIPLETDLWVDADAAGAQWSLIDGSQDGTIMTATPSGPIIAETTPVDIEAAAAARRRFAHLDERHPVPFCFSCGLQTDSMAVHAAALADDDRYGTDWTVPGWAVAPGGAVDHGALWAALDCTSAWYVCHSRGERTAFTVRFAAEVVEPLEAEQTYALVAWSGAAGADWDGRKRHAAAAAFSSAGSCVAKAESLWVSVDT